MRICAYISLDVGQTAAPQQVYAPYGTGYVTVPDSHPLFFVPCLHVCKSVCSHSLCLYVL